MIEVIAAEFLFTCSFQKRNFFWLRLVVMLSVCCAAAVVFPHFSGHGNRFLSAVYKFSRFFLLYCLSVAGQYFLFKERFRTVLTACASGYAVEHIAQRLSVILGLFIPLFDNLEGWLGSFLRKIVYFTPMYVLLYFVFARNTKKYRPGNDYRFDVISVMVVFMCMIVSRVSEFGQRSNAAMVAEYLYSMLCCLGVLYLQRLLYVSNVKEKELYATTQLYEKSKEEFKNWQNSIDVINTKCHDLKQHLQSLNWGLSEETKREIESSVMIYDSVIKTGNEVLDLILFEKNVQCEKNAIEFVFMVDGSELGFMNSEDIFALFGNLLANAIDASLAIEEKEKRVIHLSVFVVENTVVIHEENYYIGKEIQIENGLPVTTKTDKNEHGYGVRSMKLIVEKYGGSIGFHSKGDVFALNICMPIQKKKV